MTGDFVLDWERALGYKADPFVDKTLEPASQYLVNRKDEKEKLTWFFIKGYFYGTILGEHGVGKTLMLKWLEENLKRYNKVHCVYINAGVFKEQINIGQQILAPLLSAYEKFWSRPHMKIVGFEYVPFLKKKLGSRSVALLIDNAHNLTERNMELLKQLREEGLKIQVIVSTTQQDYEKSLLNEFGADELNLALRRLTFEESREMIKKRITAFGGHGIHPFHDELLSRIYEKADKNPRQFLHMCRDEAIRVLIHKQESGSSPVAPAAASSPAEKPVRRVSDVQRDAAAKDGKKKGFFSVKFDMGSKQAVQRPASRDVLAPPKFGERQGIHNDKFNQALIDKLASTNPKKRQPSNQNVQGATDIDRILMEMSKNSASRDREREE